MPELTNAALIIIILSILNGLLVFLHFYNLYNAKNNHKEEQKSTYDDVTPIVVHELRSPLTVIKGTSDMLLTEFDNFSRDQVNAFLNQIRDSSTSLLGLVNNILDESKIHSGTYQINKAKIDINKLLKEELTYYHGLAKDRGLTLIFNLDDKVKEIMADKERIKQVMNNLLSNAIKFTDKGGFIRIASHGYGDYIEVCVTDSGRGVPEDVKSKLFTRFAQGHDPKNHEKGTGLGLAISKGIVDAHGGKIWYETNVPKGSKFIFTLPIS